MASKDFHIVAETGNHARLSNFVGSNCQQICFRYYSLNTKVNQLTLKSIMGVMSLGVGHQGADAVISAEGADADAIAAISRNND